jgi:hypothetical protein
MLRSTSFVITRWGCNQMIKSRFCNFLLLLLNGISIQGYVLCPSTFMAFMASRARRLLIPEFPVDCIKSFLLKVTEDHFWMLGFQWNRGNICHWGQHWRVRAPCPISVSKGITTSSIDRLLGQFLTISPWSQEQHTALPFRLCYCREVLEPFLACLQNHIVLRSNWKLQHALHSQGFFRLLFSSAFPN